MVIDLIGVLENGAAPDPGLPRDTRKPLELAAGQTTTVRLRAVTRDGAPIVLADGDTITLTARESTIRPSRRYFSAAFVVDTSRGRGWYVALISAAATRFLGGARGVFDVWITRAGAEDPLVEASALYIGGVAVDPGVAPPASAGLAAPQDGAERSFPWTCTVTGTTQTIAIPGGGMRDATYSIDAFNLRDPAPGDGAHPDMRFPAAGQTASSFQVVTDAPIRAGSTYYVVLRDNA